MGLSISPALLKKRTHTAVQPRSVPALRACFARPRSHARVFVVTVTSVCVQPLGTHRLYVFILSINQQTNESFFSVFVSFVVVTVGWQMYPVLELWSCEQ